MSVEETAQDAGAEEQELGIAQVYYPVAPGTQLNVRSGPGTGYSLVKVLPLNTRVPINCQMQGTTVAGYYGTTNIWDNIGNGEFVSDAYVKTGSDGYIAPRCNF
ncbi:peptidase [Streptomyces roseirectus]|uniref:Peptidase n=1 Tax=Streptomyces roseirectus TaxID=2768066 RepID=A0A7H0IDX4_9ACTN|nr:peptidase [Streptomyces roseirectus]QNP70990.1 peptidase [Streptomyces roseirectus]